MLGIMRCKLPALPPHRPAPGWRACRALSPAGVVADLARLKPCASRHDRADFKHAARWMKRESCWQQSPITYLCIARQWLEMSDEVSFEHIEMGLFVLNQTCYQSLLQSRILQGRAVGDVECLPGVELLQQARQILVRQILRTGDISRLGRDHVAGFIGLVRKSAGNSATARRASR